MEKKHNNDVTEFTNNFRLLETENYNLTKIKDDLTRESKEKDNDIRNAQFDLKYTQDEANKRQITIKDKNRELEQELNKEKENIRKME